MYAHIYKKYDYIKMMVRFIVHLSVLVRSDLSQLLYSFWRVGIIMSKLKNKLCMWH